MSQPGDELLILLVDNDEDWRMIIESSIFSEEYSITRVQNFKDATENLWAFKEAYKLLILNVMLDSNIEESPWRQRMESLLLLSRKFNIETIIVTDGFESAGENNEEMEAKIKEKFNVHEVFYKKDIDLEKFEETVKKVLRLNGSPNGVISATRTQTILFLAASPKDQEVLHLDVEIRTIDERLRSAEYRSRFNIQQHWAVRYSDLSEYLLRHKPHILHFSGHGSTTGKIILQNDAGQSKTVTPEALARLLKIVKQNIRCVVLSACYSEIWALAIIEEIDCVVGMSRAFDDETAVSFSAGFYRGLGFGLSVLKSFELGKNEIDLAKLPDGEVPQLLCKKDVDPSQIKFV